MKYISSGWIRAGLFAVAGVLLLGSARAQEVPHFLAPNDSAAGSNVVASAAGDFNGDGIADIVTANNSWQSISILHGNANKTFQPPQNFSVGGNPTAVAVGDFNNDGKIDVAAASNNGVVSVLLGNGDGTLAPAKETTADTGAFSLAVGDINHDGKLDLAVGVFDNVAILLGNGDGTFNETRVLVTSHASCCVPTREVLLADFNHDGLLDLVTAVGVSLGHGDGTFDVKLRDIADQLNVGGGFATGDFNGDGKLDLAQIIISQGRATADSTLSIASGNGDGTFGESPFSLPVGQIAGAPVVADFDGDGKADVAVKQQTTSAISLFLGRGDGTVQGAIDVETGNAVSTNLAAADLDNNGSSDLVQANLTHNDVTVLWNTSGNLPLLALATLNPASVVGGAANVQGAVFLGGVAPAGGTIITLAVNGSSASLPATQVTIPAGNRSGTFQVATSSVDTVTSNTISATLNDVTQSNTLQVVPPYSLASLSVTPTSQIDTLSATGTVTLTGPADSSAVVLLASNNPAATVPASITVVAGSNSASFPIALQTVAVNTPVTISGSIDGATRSAVLTVLKPMDTLKITRAEYDVSQSSLRVEATGSNAAATLTVFNADTGQMIATMANNRGSYSLRVNGVGAIKTVLIKSSLGGTAMGAVSQK